MTPYYQDDNCRIFHADVFDVMASLPDNSIDVIATDPPYFKVKGEDWDNQWEKPDAFLAWIGRICDEWQRILKPNGSLYCFASPQMSARVEIGISQRFNVLNNIRWVKDAGWHKKADKEAIRSYLSPWEAIIFAEHFGADNIAKGEAGYEAKCDELRGFVFEPLRAYLDGERIRAGVSVRQVAEAFQQKTGSRTVTGMAGHWFTSVQWALPTEENYTWLRSTLSSLNHQGEYLPRKYEELRKEYEELRKEYEELRRPFNVTADVPYTDIWDFPTVPATSAKHICEKPLPLMAHILRSSGKPGCVAFDGFMGSGTTLKAAKDLGFQAIGCDRELKHCETAAGRLRQQRLFMEATA